MTQILSTLLFILYLSIPAHAQVSHTIVDTDSAQTLMSKTIGGNTSTTANVDIITKGPWVDVRAFGAKGDGVTDDTAAIQAAINSATSGTVIVLPKTSYSYIITSTLNFTLKSGITFRGLSDGNGDSATTPIKWNGTNNGVVMLLDRTRDSSFEGFSLIPGTGTIGVGIDLDETVNSGQPSSHNYFAHIQIQSANIGVRISNLDTWGNNEDHVFDHIDLYQGQGVTSYGFYWVDYSGQAKNIRLSSTDVSGFTYGIYLKKGAFSLIHGDFGGNGTDIYLDQPSDVIPIWYLHSENSGRFLQRPGNTGANHSVVVIGCRANPSAVNVDNQYMILDSTGPFIFIGNDFTQGGVNQPNVQFTMSNAIPVNFTFISNSFANSTPFNTGAGNAYIYAMGNQYWNNGASQWQPLPDLLTTKNAISYSNQIISTLATGTAPLSVASTTPNTNLNAFAVTYDNAGSQRTNQGLGWNTTSLVNGSQTVTFSSTSVYSSSTSYTLFATTESVGGTVSVIQNSGTSATIKGANTEKVHWFTIGN